jgi:hypothetical protein
MTYKEMREQIAAQQQQLDMQAAVTPLLCTHTAVIFKWIEEKEPEDVPTDVAKAIWLLSNCFPEEVPDGGSENTDV